MTNYNNLDGCQRVLTSMIYKFFDKNQKELGHWLKWTKWVSKDVNSLEYTVTWTCVIQLLNRNKLKRFKLKRELQKTDHIALRNETVLNR